MKLNEKAKETSTVSAQSECIKICGKCGKEWKEVPFRARPLSGSGAFDGFYWECECNSTLFVPQSFMSRRASHLMSNPDYEEHG